jgi:hypothetical protein
MSNSRYMIVGVPIVTLEQPLEDFTATNRVIVFVFENTDANIGTEVIAVDPRNANEYTVIYDVFQNGLLLGANSPDEKFYSYRFVKGRGNVVVNIARGKDQWEQLIESLLRHYVTSKPRIDETVQ